MRTIDKVFTLAAIVGCFVWLYGYSINIAGDGGGPALITGAVLFFGAAVYRIIDS